MPRVSKVHTLFLLLIAACLIVSLVPYWSYVSLSPIKGVKTTLQRRRNTKETRSAKSKITSPAKESAQHPNPNEKKKSESEEVQLLASPPSAAPTTPSTAALPSLIEQLKNTVLDRRTEAYPRDFFSFLPVVPKESFRTTTPPFTVPDTVCLSCYRTLSMHPRVLLFDRLFTDAEAAHMTAVGTPLLTRSGVVAKQSIMSVRTSSGARLSNSDPMIKAVDRRLLYVLNHFNDNKKERMFKAGNAERLEMLRYEGSQQYFGHLDTFGGIDGPLAKARRKRIKDYWKEVEKKNVSGSNKTALPTVPSGLREPLLERAATMVLFLRNASSESIAVGGGTTTLPYSAAGFDPTIIHHQDDNAVDNLLKWWAQKKRFRAGKDSPCIKQDRANVETFLSEEVLGSPDSRELIAALRQHHDNSTGPFFTEIGETLHVTPVVGSVLLFYDTFENGVSDGFSLHAGCPPLPAEKRAEVIEKRRAEKKAAVAAGMDAGSQLDGSRQEVEEEEWIKAHFVKEIATKWFLIPIIDGVSSTLE